MSEVCRIVDDINRAVPKHGRGLIDPEKILRERRSNCFGKIALTGAGLLDVGIAERELRIVISENHGVEFSNSRYWFGHAGLVLVEAGVLIDGMNLLQIDDTHARFGEESLEAGQIVTDLSKVAAVKPVDGYTAEQLTEIQELVGPPVVHKRAPLFKVYEFTEGIAQYQDRHPDLRSREQHTVADYTVCCQRLVA